MMLVMKNKRDLFGGALRHAGLAAAAALANNALADFEPAVPPSGLGPNLISLNAHNTSGAYVNDYASAAGAAFPTAQGYFGGGLVMAAYASTAAMGASITVTDAATWDDYAFINMRQWFTVAHTKQVVFEWVLTSVSYADARVYQAGVGDITPLVGAGTSGSIVLTLMPGETYAFTGFMSVLGVEGGGYVRLANVPAPGAIALLGVGSLAARRRRRRA